MAWPKTIEISGIKVSVDSWEEIKEAIAVFGGDITVSSDTNAAPRNPPPAHASQGSHGGSLTHADMSLLRSFADNQTRGVLTADLGPALGKRGKAIRTELNVFARRVGLSSTEGALVFEPYVRSDGRAYRLTAHALRTANQILGR